MSTILPAKSREQVVTDPATLSCPEEDIIEDITKSESPPKLILCLLHPLINPDMLAACRNPSSRFMHMTNGSQGPLTNHEFLNLAPLSREWRQALARTAPRAEVDFDIRVPDRNGQKIYWDTSLPAGGGVAVEMRQVMTMAVTIATGMRMRVKGACRFGVSFDEDTKLRGDSMKGLQRQLIMLAESRGEGKAGDEGGWVVV